MKKKLSILFCSVISLTFTLNAQEMSLKEAAKIAKVNAKALNKAGITKVMFIEFYGDFVTSKETSPSTMSQRYSSAPGGTYMSSVEISDDYYETATNEIYEAIKKVFTDNGIEVLDKSVLLENEDYIALGLKEEKKRREYSGSVTKKSTVNQTVRRSVTSMGMWSETLKVGAVVKIKKIVPKIAKENGCQAAVITKFRIGMGKKGSPTLESLNTTMDYGIDSYGKGDKETFFFKKGGLALFTANQTLKSDSDLFGKKGTADASTYHSNIMEMINHMSKAYSIQLKDQLEK